MDTPILEGTKIPLPLIEAPKFVKEITALVCGITEKSTCMLCVCAGIAYYLPQAASRVHSTAIFSFFPATSFCYAWSLAFVSLF